MTKKQLLDEMTKFIEYYTQDSEQRLEMGLVLLEFILDVYEYPEQEVTMVFHKEDDTYKVSIKNGSYYSGVSFYIKAEDREKYIQQFTKAKYTVHVG